MLCLDAVLWHRVSNIPTKAYVFGQKLSMRRNCRNTHARKAARLAPVRMVTREPLLSGLCNEGELKARQQRAHVSAKGVG